MGGVGGAVRASAAAPRARMYACDAIIAPVSCEIFGSKEPPAAVHKLSVVPPPPIPRRNHPFG